MEKTRVYIDIIKEDGIVKIVMKNIASYELNFNVNEITERFKRADEARSSEGSGLGLAIAKSIVELHEGKLDIQIDGDLFKVCIRFLKSPKK
jgi:signal transduction histidine kinase